MVHALTREHGRIELIAKGAHRLKSRYSGVLDWFDSLDLNWSPPRGDSEDPRGGRPGRRKEQPIGSARVGGLGTLRTGDVETRRRWITASLETYRAAHTAIELTDLATRAGFADPELFRLLEHALDEFDAVGRALNVADEESAAAVLAPLPLRLARFELRLLASLGLQPALIACAACGGPAPAARPSAAAPGEAPGESRSIPRAPFSPQAGGRLCSQHAQEAHAAGHKVGTLPIDVLEGAHALVDPTDAARTKALLLEQVGERPEFGERILDFAGRFLDHQLETRPKSHGEFLGAPDRNSRARLRA